jgi:hypothetical protein
MTHDDIVVACYHRVRREPIEGTAGAAIQEHSVACGLVAYVFGLHPDYVARCLAERIHDDR